MLMKRNQFFAWLALGLALAAPASVRAADGPYRLLKEIPVGGASSWDYLSVDEAGRRLYVSHGTEVVVIDIDKDTVVGKIAEHPARAWLCARAGPGARRRQQRRREQGQRGGFENAGNDRQAGHRRRIRTASVYEPGQHEVYLFNGGSASATVINLKDAKVVATIPLGGKPEFPHSRSGGGARL